MDQFTQKYVDGFMADLIARNPGEKEFHQAVREVLESVAPYIVEHPYLIRGFFWRTSKYKRYSATR